MAWARGQSRGQSTAPRVLEGSGSTCRLTLRSASARGDLLLVRSFLGSTTLGFLGAGFFLDTREARGFDMMVKAIEGVDEVIVWLVRLETSPGQAMFASVERGAPGSRGSLSRLHMLRDCDSIETKADGLIQQQVQNVARLERWLGAEMSGESGAGD